jgi:hypothetical protein
MALPFVAGSVLHAADLNLLAPLNAPAITGNASISGNLTVGGSLNTHPLPSGTSTISTSLRTINSQTGTTYTLALSDGSQTGLNPIVSCANAAAVTVTLPLNATVAYPIGAEIQLIQDGTGKVTIAPASGVTINSLNGNKSIGGQFAGATLIQEAADTWYLIGNLIA